MKMGSPGGVESHAGKLQRKKRLLGDEESEGRDGSGKIAGRKRFK